MFKKELLVIQEENLVFTNLENSEVVEDVKVDLSKTYSVIDNLYHTIQKRKNEDITKSYTAKLLNGSQNSMLKKL